MTVYYKAKIDGAVAAAQNSLGDAQHRMFADLIDTLIKRISKHDYKHRLDHLLREVLFKPFNMGFSAQSGKSDTIRGPGYRYLYAWAARISSDICANSRETRAAGNFAVFRKLSLEKMEVAFVKGWATAFLMRVRMTPLDRVKFAKKYLQVDLGSDQSKVSSVRCRQTANALTPHKADRAAFLRWALTHCKMHIDGRILGFKPPENGSKEAYFTPWSYRAIAVGEWEGSLLPASKRTALLGNQIESFLELGLMRTCQMPVRDGAAEEIMTFTPDAFLVLYGMLKRSAGHNQRVRESKKLHPMEKERIALVKSQIARLEVQDLVPA